MSSSSASDTRTSHRACAVGNEQAQGRPAPERGPVPRRPTRRRARVRWKQRHGPEHHRRGCVPDPRPRAQRHGIHLLDDLQFEDLVPWCEAAQYGRSSSSPHCCESRAGPVRRSIRSRSFDTCSSAATFEPSRATWRQKDRLTRPDRRARGSCLAGRDPVAEPSDGVGRLTRGACPQNPSPVPIRFGPRRRMHAGWWRAVRPAEPPSP